MGFVSFTLHASQPLQKQTIGSVITYAVLTVASVARGVPFVKQFNIYLNEDIPYKATIASMLRVNYLIWGGGGHLRP